ncbi:MAG TPA: DUF1080 domain-containing protein [Chitinophagaceae bacterium]|nr:DUF1080 domain-containing protein [Chitinophagaceae bacterium]
MRKKILYLLVIAVIIAACNPTKTTTPVDTSMNTDTSMSSNTSMNANALTTEEKNEGWQLLFDGTTTNGWHAYGKQAAGNAWKVADGSLFFDADAKKNSQAQGGDIVTNDEFENFHLKLDWKISPNGNSGIMFYVNEDSAKYQNTYNTGPEMQVLDNAGHPDAKITKHRAGDLYDLISVSKETVKPVGEWNTAEIIADKGNLRFRLNGEEVVNTTMWDDAWRTMLANSKFKTMPGFGTFKKGKIALQDHGDNVWYRNIKIRKL